MNVCTQKMPTLFYSRKHFFLYWKGKVLFWVVDMYVRTSIGERLYFLDDVCLWILVYYEMNWFVGKKRSGKDGEEAFFCVCMCYFHDHEHDEEKKQERDALFCLLVLCKGCREKKKKKNIILLPSLSLFSLMVCPRVSVFIIKFISIHSRHGHSIILLCYGYTEKILVQPNTHITCINIK